MVNTTTGQNSARSAKLEFEAFWHVETAGRKQVGREYEARYLSALVVQKLQHIIITVDIILFDTVDTNITVHTINKSSIRDESVVASMKIDHWRRFSSSHSTHANYCRSSVTVAAAPNYVGQVDRQLRVIRK